jgi:hypothetical protein
MTALGQGRWKYPTNQLKKRETMSDQFAGRGSCAAQDGCQFMRARAHERTLATSDADLTDDVQDKTGPRRDSGRERVRLNEAPLEIDSSAIPDSAIHGLIEDWIVPMIVERVINCMIAPPDNASLLQNRSFDTYNYLGSNDCSGEEEFDGRASAQACTVEAEPAASTDVDAGRV